MARSNSTGTGVASGKRGSAGRLAVAVAGMALAPATFGLSLIATQNATAKETYAKTLSRSGTGSYPPVRGRYDPYVSDESSDW